MKPFIEYQKNWMIWILVIVVLLVLCGTCKSEETIKASWYSVESLKKEGSWAIWKGVMSNGEQFNDDAYTCASRMHNLGTMLMVTNLNNGARVQVKVTDKIGKRFAKTRIDLSKKAFSQIANLKWGVVPIKIEVIK